MVPVLKPEKTILLVAHSNTIRALVSHLDQVPEDQIPNIHIPNGVPCVYQFSKDGATVLPRLENDFGGTRGHWLFSVENQRRLRNKIGGTSSFFQSIFDAWDVNGDGVLTREEIVTGLRQLMGGDDIAVRFIAAKLLERIDMEGSATLDPQQFYHFAAAVYRKNYLPGFMKVTVAKEEGKTGLFI